MDHGVFIYESMILESKVTLFLGQNLNTKRRVPEQSIPFSAFWLRSSVVSVLISLISDTWPIGSHDIKLIFQGGRPITVACCWDLRASPMRCTSARARRTPSKSIQIPLINHVLSCS
ncbi:hypothetical protein I3843_02G069700 [Carya illinoinensis]|nr:hypothetical protein I3843_02G069700 [Carya illinoinensis]